MAFGNSLRIVVIGLVFTVLSAGYLITMIPAGDTYQVRASVENRTSRSGATGNVGILLCVLSNGRRVSVEVPAVATVQTGDKVVLNSYDRYFLEPKYSFAGKLLSGS